MSTVDNRGIAHAESTDGTVTAFNRRAPRLSQADVFQAADELLVEGHRPTIDRVRVRLGRGSPNTINDHLDAWWAKLGARLRDLPGQEFPQMPERIAQTLQKLWTQALEGAHETLRSSLESQQALMAQQEQQLGQRATELAERESVAHGRTSALEEALALARTQLIESNRRAASLEEALRERDAALSRVRTRVESLERDSAALIQQRDSERVVQAADRERLEQRHTATEARWLAEVDRARQALKESERHAKHLQTQLTQTTAARELLKTELIEARAQVGAAHELRVQLEERIRLLSQRQTAKATAAPKRRLNRERSAARKSAARTGDS